jgi:isoleucyl-tRNA synthetase
MKANSAIREIETQRFWDTEKIYEQNLEQRKGCEKFVVHDGPPYLSSHKIHMGHALNKTLKDIVTKYKAQQGFYSPFVPGYDSHGLPIENAVLKEVKGGRASLTVNQLRTLCKEFALKNLKGQEGHFRRLGVWGDWENPYITLDRKFEATQIRVFGKMATAGYLYKGLKPVYWCTNCETALAEAEVEYADHVSDSIYVKFAVKPSSKEKLPKFVPGDADVSFVIWTTTPWTLPANLGISLHPDFQYHFLQTPNDGVLVVAEQLKDSFLAAVGIDPNAVKYLGTIAGKNLDRIEAIHPFIDRTSLVMVGDHVTAEVGTGAVHTAPGHGMEDFIIGNQYKLAILSPVDSRGVFSQEAGKFAGLRYDKANPEIVSYLQELGKLLSHSSYAHSYPHCWRCKKPLIFRATEQWFASVDGFRKKALEAIDTVTWIPSAGRNRIYNMVENRSDWCISRQRSWGVPIPVFYCENNHPLMSEKSIESVAKVFEKEGSDTWWDKEADYFLGNDFSCDKCGGKQFTKEPDIMDVWFDSGITHAAVLDGRPELGGTPCELYLEGSDQHRGWFNSSLSTSVAVSGRAPFKTVLTHGFVLDENGRAMSKSLGNIVEPEEMIKQYGADVVRLWVASVNYTGDVLIGKNHLAQLAEIYRKLRNTARYMLGNLHDFDPAKDTVAYKDLPKFDAYILHKLQTVLEEIIEDFDNYEFFKYYQLLQNFCVVDLSSFYFDIVKDRLYTAGQKSQSRRAVQTVLNEVLQVLVRLLVPVTPHTAEDIWQHMPAQLKGKEKSVLLTDFPKPKKEYINPQLAEFCQEIISVRATVNKALEMARAERKIGSSLEAQVVLQADEPKLAEKLLALSSELPTFFITSQATIVAGQASSTNGVLSQVAENGIEVKVLPAMGSKCPRCWKFAQDIGHDARFAELCAPCVEALTTS